MDQPYLLSEAQMHQIEPFFPLSHGIPRVDDRLIALGIIVVIKNRLRWRDAPLVRALTALQGGFRPGPSISV
jgi:transposase